MIYSLSILVSGNDETNFRKVFIIQIMFRPKVILAKKLVTSKALLSKGKHFNSDLYYPYKIKLLQQ